MYNVNVGMYQLFVFYEWVFCQNTLSRSLFTFSNVNNKDFKKECANVL